MNNKKIKTLNALNLKLVEFDPATKKQEEAVRFYKQGYNLLFHGYAGTGKTFIALSLAMNELRVKGVKRVLIVRSAVSSRNIGYLPGNENEKMAVFQKPYSAICSEIFERGDAWQILTKMGLVEFQSTSFFRGTTLDDTFLIVDECQNLSDQEMNTMMTRVGRNSKVIIVGDARQNDIENKSSFSVCYNVFKKMDRFVKIVEFGVDDIVRSEFVKNWIINFEEFK